MIIPPTLAPRYENEMVPVKLLSIRQHHVQWEDEMGRYGFRGRIVARNRSRDRGELRPGSARDRLASANSAAGAGNGAGVVSAGMGRTERPNLCFRRRHSSLCERHDGR